jgi:hypothetical protein
MNRSLGWVGSNIADTITDIGPEPLVVGLVPVIGCMETWWGTGCRSARCARKLARAWLLDGFVPGGFGIVRGAIVRGVVLGMVRPEWRKAVGMVLTSRIGAT